MTQNKLLAIKKWFGGHTIYDKIFLVPYKWQPKIDLSHYPKKLDRCIWTKIFQSLLIEFGKWACNMFLESFR
jgi:hypothetical protein